MPSLLTTTDRSINLSLYELSLVEGLLHDRLKPINLLPTCGYSAYQVTFPCPEPYCLCVMLLGLFTAVAPFYALLFSVHSKLQEN